MALIKCGASTKDSFVMASECSDASGLNSYSRSGNDGSWQATWVANVTLKKATKIKCCSWWGNCSSDFGGRAFEGFSSGGSWVPFTYDSTNKLWYPPNETSYTQVRGRVWSTSDGSIYHRLDISGISIFKK